MKNTTPNTTSQNVIKEANISLVLDAYTDLFSDFDPRPSSQRALSDDFLAECKRAAYDKNDNGIELRFLIPKKLRKRSDEEIINQRLKEHFHKHFTEKIHLRKKLRKEGLVAVLGGVCLSLIATALYQRGLDDLFTKFLFLLMEPGGWFLIWTGFDKIIVEINDKIPDYEFYRKMSKVQISFHSY